MGNFARILHHLDMKDVKRRHLKELAARKIKEEQDKKEEKVIQEIAKKYIPFLNINMLQYKKHLIEQIQRKN